MVDFARLAETARRLIRANGRPVIVRKLSTTPEDPEKPWLDNSDAHEDLELIVAFFEYDEAEVDGTSIKRGDQVGYAEAPVDGEKLEDFNQIIDGDLTWQIEEARPIRPGDTSVVYIMQLRN